MVLHFQAGTKDPEHYQTDTDNAGGVAEFNCRGVNLLASSIHHRRAMKLRRWNLPVMNECKGMAKRVSLVLLLLR